MKASDVIVLSSKKSGGYDGGIFNETCHKIIPSFLTRETKQYISTAFKENNSDYELYAVANAALDRTIDSLGRQRVEKEVLYHRHLQRVAEKACQKEAIFPCSRDGARQISLSTESCYTRDFGCGHECIRRVLKSF
jgi:hypothetical protein